MYKIEVYFHHRWKKILNKINKSIFWTTWKMFKLNLKLLKIDFFCVIIRKNIFSWFFFNFQWTSQTIVNNSIFKKNKIVITAVKIILTYINQIWHVCAFNIRFWLIYLNFYDFFLSGWWDVIISTFVIRATIQIWLNFLRPYIFFVFASFSIYFYLI